MDSKSAVTIIDSAEGQSFLSFIRKNLREIWHYRFAFYNFVLNSLRTRYRRSALGFIWSLVNPLLNLVIISVVFSLIFKQQITTYSMYIFSGLVPWNFINLSFAMGCPSLVYSEPYLKKVYLPKIIFPLVSVSTEAVNFSFSMISIYIIALLLGADVGWSVFLVPVAMLIMYLFNLGWVLILSVTSVYFRDMFQIVSVVMSALFYTVPIVYPLEQIPEQFRGLFLWNPLYYFINLFRKLIYEVTIPSPIEWGIPLLIAILSLAVGLFILMKREKDIVFRL